ncbi:MAG: protein kinase [Gemmataceae bacterium]|nr:protein kinase [Gemmataceae bacterium]
MSRDDPCPSIHALHQLLLGRIPDPEAVPLEEHLESCDRCLQTLHGLPPGDPLVLALERGRTIATQMPDGPMVEGLMERLRGLMDKAPIDPHGPADLLALESAGEAASGEPPVVAGYEILQKLGRGGMGVVYKARQVRLKRLVALKMILAGPYAGPEQLARFRAEAEVAAHLQHPHIVPIYEVGEWRAGEAGPPLPYFAMEFLDGGSLAQCLDGTPLPARPAAQLVETLARAVYYAHQQGVVHRDLKPANVLLSRIEDRGSRIEEEPATVDPRSSVPKISDFGLAKQLTREGETPASGRQTQSGVLLGTPSYMAPEQAAGKTREIGPATDIYALGAMLYEILTGRPPFQAVTVWETLEQVRTQEPVPPRHTQPRLPRDLETICLKCLEKEPYRRYSSALELAEDLHRFLQGEPIRARPVSSAERMWKWVQRRPLVAALVGVSGLAVLTQGAGVVAHNARLRAEAQRAEAGEAEARKQQHRADGHYREARAALNRMLERLKQKGAADVPGLKELQRLQLEDALAFYEGILKEQDHPDPAVRLDVALAHQQTANIQRLLGRPGPAEDNLQQAVGFLRALAAESPEVLDYRAHLAACYSDLGGLYSQRGYAADHRQVEQAAQCHRQALELRAELAHAQPGVAEWRSALAKSHHSLGAAYQLLAGMRHDPAGFAQAEAHYSQAVALNMPVSREDHRVKEYQVALAGTHINLGLLYHQTKRGDRAETAYQQAESLLEPLLRDQPQEDTIGVSLGKMYGNWANLLADTRQAEAALEKYARAIHVMEAILRQEPHHGPARRTLLNAHGGRANAHHGLKRYAEAVQDWQRVVELADEPDRAPYRASLAVALAHAGEHVRATAEARALLEQAQAAGDTLYDAARACALSARAVRQDDRLTATARDSRAERYATLGVALLTRLQAAGYFQDRARAGRLEDDPDLESLRAGPEFQKLLQQAARK